MRKFASVHTIASSAISILLAFATPHAAFAASLLYKDVCASGCTYNNVQSAIDSITDSSATNVYTIFLDAGVLETATPITMSGKSYINLVGRGMGVSVIRANANFFINNQGSSVDVLDLSNSTNITIRGLTIDGRTGDPCNSGNCVGAGTFYNGVQVTNADRILLDGAEVMGITYGFWENPNSSSHVIQVFGSKILSSNYGIGIHGAVWHIFSSDVRAVRTGPQSGVVAVVFGVNVGASSIENSTIWGSHIHAELGQAGQVFNVAAVNFGFAQGSNFAIIGSTMHVKITTTNIGASDRTMYALRSFPACGASTPTANVNVVATDLLYESPAGLSQGRLGGLGYGSGNRCVAFNLSGASFIDGGGSGGTYRGDIIGDPFIFGPNRYEPTVYSAGSRITKVLNPNGVGFTTGSGALSQTSNNQIGTVTFQNSDTVSVTFKDDRGMQLVMPDTNYRIALSATAQETVYVSSRTTTGFTLKSSNANSTSAVDWIVLR